MKRRFLLIFSIALIGLLAVRGVALAQEIHLFDDRGSSASQTVKLISEDSPSTQAETNDDRGVQVKIGDDRGLHLEPGDDRGMGLEPGDDRGMGLEPGDDHGAHLEPGDDKGGLTVTAAPVQMVDDKGGLRNNPAPSVQSGANHRQNRGSDSGRDQNRSGGHK